MREISGRLTLAPQGLLGESNRRKAEQKSKTARHMLALPCQIKTQKVQKQGPPCSQDPIQGVSTLLIPQGSFLPLETLFHSGGRVRESVGCIAIMPSLLGRNRGYSP